MTPKKINLDSAVQDDKAMQSRFNPIKRVSHFLLLEVMISFALIVLCVLPLISPHIAIFKSQKDFVDRIELDHVVNLLYGDMYASLYRNEIPWESVISENQIPIDDIILERIGWKKPFPFTGSYHFGVVKYKPKKEAPYRLYLISLTYEFTPKGKESKPFKYEYEIFIERNLGGEAAGSTETPKDTNVNQQAQPPQK